MEGLGGVAGINEGPEYFASGRKENGTKAPSVKEVEGILIKRHRLIHR